MDVFIPPKPDVKDLDDPLINYVPHGIKVARRRAREAFEETGKDKSKPGHDHIPITGLTLDEIEKEVILKTLHKNGGNKSKTSEILGITLRTLRNKLELYGHEGKTV